ncbi:type IV pilus assembly protein PilM [Candidatus Riflebacteria bacterium]
MGLFSFGSGSNIVTTFDIGTSSIKMVEMKKAGDRPKITNFGHATLPAEAIVDGKIQDQQIVIETLKKLVKDSGIRPGKVHVCLSGQNVIMRFIKLPNMPDEELDHTVKFEAEQYVPYAIDDVSITHSKLEMIEEAEGGGQYSILLVVAQKVDVQAMQDVIKAGVGQAEVIEVDALSAINALENQVNGKKAEREQEEDYILGILEVGARTTNINVLKNGILQFTRSIPIAGNDITSVIQSVLKLDFEQAEEIKKAEGLGGGEGEGESEVGEIVRTVAEEWSSEIRRSFDYYKAQSREPMIHEVLLMGGTANLINLSNFLDTELGISVDVGEPIDGIDVDVTDPEEFEKRKQELAICIGMGLRGVTEED